MFNVYTVLCTPSVLHLSSSWNACHLLLFILNCTNTTLAYCGAHTYAHTHTHIILVLIFTRLKPNQFCLIYEISKTFKRYFSFVAVSKYIFLYDFRQIYLLQFSFFPFSRIATILKQRFYNM